MPNPLDVTLHESAEEAASGSGASVDLGDLRQAVGLVLEVLSGAGSLVVTLETAPTNAGPWRPQTSFAALAGTGHAELACSPVARFVRAAWTITSGGPFTFELRGTAHVVYCTPADLASATLTVKALSTTTQDVQAKACIDASNEADGYLASRYTLPLSAWPSDLRRKVAAMAACDVLTQRGFQPQGPDELIVQNRRDAVSWLMRVGAGTISPPGIADSTPAKRGSTPRLTSNPSRGWKDSC